MNLIFIQTYLPERAKISKPRHKYKRMTCIGKARLECMWDNKEKEVQMQDSVFLLSLSGT